MNKKILIISAIILGIILATLAGLFLYLKPAKSDPILKPVKILFVGDLMLDRYVADLDRRKGIGYFFDKIIQSDKNFFSGYDLVSANLEGAVTNNGEHYSPVNGNDFAFLPENVSSLKKYNFNFFNIANNHLYDQGEKGYQETKQNLDSLKFDYSGCPDRMVGDCSVKILNISEKKIGMVGASMVYGVFDTEKLKKQIQDLKSKTDFIVVNIHWGAEYAHNYNKVQQKTAHELIDAGADIIVGHHPHVVQGVEIYKNHPIFYSLGNFIFDQYFSSDTQEGLSLGMNYSSEKLEINLYPLKSKNSQVVLMNEKEKTDFFEQMLKWSPDLVLTNWIKDGKLVIY